MKTQPCELGAVLFKHIKLDNLSNIYLLKNSLMLLLILLSYELEKVKTSVIACSPHVFKYASTPR